LSVKVPASRHDTRDLSVLRMSSNGLASKITRSATSNFDSAEVCGLPKYTDGLIVAVCNASKDENLHHNKPSSVCNPSQQDRKSRHRPDLKRAPDSAHHLDKLDFQLIAALLRFHIFFITDLRKELRRSTQP